VIAQRPNLFGDTTGTISIVANTPTSAYPATLLRLDKMWMLHPTSGLPAYPLNRIDMVGGQGLSRKWPLTLIAPAAPGRVDSYWTDARNVYWSPQPGQDDTVRWYGFTPASDITAAGTFAYPDIAAMPIAAFATKLMRIGVGDGSLDLDAAVTAFGAVVDTLSHFNRDRAPGFIYQDVHTT